MRRKFIALTALGLFLIGGIAATRPPGSFSLKDPDDPRYKNLKIIPKDISDESMGQLMESYARGIGVTCQYCHADNKKSGSERRMDFASDEKPEKEIARKMMRMTARINKKYFHVTKFNYDYDSYRVSPMNCRTCHRGMRIPPIKNGQN
jgi:hypothetical protein